MRKRLLVHIGGMAIVLYLAGALVCVLCLWCAWGSEAVGEYGPPVIAPVTDLLGSGVWMLCSCVGQLVAWMSAVFRVDDSALTVFASIEGAIAGIAIPLSLNMVARISERYESEIVTEYFRSLWQVKLLPVFIVGSLLFTVTSLLLDRPAGTPSTFGWPAAALFFCSCGWLINFLRVMQRHSDSRYLMDVLHGTAEKIIKR